LAAISVAIGTAGDAFVIVAAAAAAVFHDATTVADAVPVAVSVRSCFGLSQVINSRNMCILRLR
jgi:hypothetical protein